MTDPTQPAPNEPTIEIKIKDQELYTRLATRKTMRKDTISWLMVITLAYFTYQKSTEMIILILGFTFFYVVFFTVYNRYPFLDSKPISGSIQKNYIYMEQKDTPIPLFPDTKLTIHQQEDFFWITLSPRKTHDPHTYALCSPSNDEAQITKLAKEISQLTHLDIQKTKHHKFLRLLETTGCT